MKVVSLFSGCGALDLGLEQVHTDAPLLAPIDVTCWWRLELNMHAHARAPMPRLLSFVVARCTKALSQESWQVHLVATVVHDRPLRANAGLKPHALRRRQGTRSFCSARVTRVRSKC